VTITILDETGETVRTLTVSKNKGINRIYWDLRYHGKGPSIRLRTPPLDYPDTDLWPEVMRLNKDGWREISGIRIPHLGPLVVPGTFTVKLKVGPNEFTETLEVIKDPNTEGTVRDIREQNELAFEIMDNMSTIAVVVNGLEWIRTQIDELESMIRNDKDYASVLRSALEFDKTAADLESKVFHLKHTHNLRVPGRLLRKLLGYGYGSVDFPPTAQQYEVHKLITKKISDLQNKYTNLINNELPKINSQLREKKLIQIAVPEKEEN
jgi:hypothetical protein